MGAYFTDITRIWCYWRDLGSASRSRNRGGTWANLIFVCGLRCHYVPGLFCGLGIGTPRTDWNTWDLGGVVYGIIYNQLCYLSFDVVSPASAPRFFAQIPWPSGHVYTTLNNHGNPYIQKSRMPLHLTLLDFSNKFPWLHHHPLQLTFHFSSFNELAVSHQ